ncbi:MAG TPA: phosphate ABC transporter permease PstA [Chloroflexota bacterium]|jgi:phosphate transport system permease protein|nr:phosphate ABC transporter permease PstA [Chloroflexota bacterium]
MMMQSTARDRTRKLYDRVGTIAASAAVIIALIPLGLMMAFVISHGVSAINLGFFTKQPQPQGLGLSGGGMGPMIMGTLIIIGLTSAIGIPIGLLSGIFLYQHGDHGFGQTVRFVSDVVAGTPSILAGVVAYALLIATHLLDFGPTAAACALALLMFPTVTRATETAIRAVPVEIREAGLALGSPEWKLIARVIVPTAASGIVTAIVLGVARVAGETAPLVFTAFGNPFYSTNLNKPIGALPLQIWTDIQQPDSPDHAAAYAGAFVLFMLVLVLNLFARGLTYRLTRRTRII